jgi:hypothetical protein
LLILGPQKLHFFQSSYLYFLKTIQMTVPPYFRFFVLPVVLAGIFAGCTKKTDDKPTKEDQIAAITWKFSKATTSGTDVSSFIQACYKDNTIRFTKASPQNTGLLNEGGTKCNAADPQERTFTWVYDDSFQKLTVTGTGGAVTILPGGSNEFTLVRVSAAELVLSQNVTLLGSTQLVEVTLIP